MTIKDIRKQEADRRRARLGELIRDHFEGSQKAFIDLTGINQGELSSLLKDKSFGSLKARAIEERAQLLKGSLEAPEGSPFYPPGYHKSAITKLPDSGQSSGIIPETLTSPSRSIKALDPREATVSAPMGLGTWREVAVVGEAQGGPDGYISINDYPPGYGHGRLKTYSEDPAAYGLKVRGDSMRPRIKSGEHIICEPSIEAQPADDVVVRFIDGKVVVKELLWIRDGEICLGSINNDVQPITRSLSTVVYIHRVVAIIPRGSGMYSPD